MEGKQLRVNFDTLPDAIIAIILIFFNEEWHIPMYEIYKLNGINSIYFYVFLTFFGQIVLMTLFKAIFLNTFIIGIKLYLLNQIQIERSHNIKKQIFKFIMNFLSSSKTKKQLKVIFLKSKFNFFYFEKVSPFPENNINNPKILKRKNLRKVGSSGIWIFQKDKLKNLIENKYFEILMIFFIIIYTIELIYKYPITQEIFLKDKIFLYCEAIFTIFFLFEVLVIIYIYPISKIFDNYHNYLKILNTLISLLAMFNYDNSFEEFGFFYVCRTFRVFRILRILEILNKYFIEMKFISNSILAVIPQLIKLFILWAIFLFVFGVFALKLLKGNLFYCENSEESIKNKNECFDYGGDWINRDIHFDNIFVAVLSLFQITTSESWSIIM